MPGLEFHPTDSSAPASLPSLRQLFPHNWSSLQFVDSVISPVLTSCLWTAATKVSVCHRQHTGNADHILYILLFLTWLLAGCYSPSLAKKRSKMPNMKFWCSFRFVPSVLFVDGTLWGTSLGQTAQSTCSVTLAQMNIEHGAKPTG